MPCARSCSSSREALASVAERARLDVQRLRCLRRRGRRGLLRRRQRAHFDEGRPVLEHVELARRRVGKIDDAAVLERPAIVHAHDHAAAVAQVRDLHVRRQRQRLVRGGHRVHVVALAVGRRCGMKARPIPGRDAALGVALGRSRARNSACPARYRTADCPSSSAAPAFGIGSGIAAMSPGRRQRRVAAGRGRRRIGAVEQPAMKSRQEKSRAEARPTA